MIRLTEVPKIPFPGFPVPVEALMPVPPVAEMQTPRPELISSRDAHFRDCPDLAAGYVRMVLRRVRQPKPQHGNKIGKRYN